MAVPIGKFLFGAAYVHLIMPRHLEALAKKDLCHVQAQEATYARNTNRHGGSPMSLWDSPTQQRQAQNPDIRPNSDPVHPSIPRIAYWFSVGKPIRPITLQLC